MKWYKFWAKDDKKQALRKAEKPIDAEALGMDFFCQLSYMAAIATSGISRSGLFYYASRLPYLSARYFKKVEFVAKAFNHDYAGACNIVGQATKESEVKSLLLRLSGALSSGEDIVNFVERESEVFSDSYGSRYERRLEVLKKWVDAYIALIMTSAIVTVMAVVTLMIGNVTTVFILTLSVLTIVVTIAGAWLIYRSAPREIKTHSLPYRSREQALVKAGVKLILSLAVIVALALWMMKVDLGWIMITAGVIIFPLGLVSWIDDNKIDKRDTDVPGFLRSLGGVSQAIGATANEAMGRLDFRSLGSLTEEVSLLYTRLLARIDPNLCWERFVGDTGSEQVNRSVRIFWDGIALGGEPQKVGNAASAFAMKITLLRAHRKLIASGFLWLTIIMHIVLSVLLIFIYRTLITFTELITTMAPKNIDTQVMPSIPTFGLYSGSSSELELLYVMVIVIIIVLSLANTFAIYAASGGHIFNSFLYLSMTIAISGTAMIVVPPVVNTMLTGF